ncbi:MAG: TrbI/VirB10 family protein, partial [Pseudomonadota bacterium]|nr:TrbI/VirB10 family protein [Pseudomonadota bacterium]
LGPPLPGDLGRPMLAAGTPPPPIATGAGSPPDPARQQAEQRRQRVAQELDAARTSRLFASEARTAQPGAGLATPSLGLAGSGTPVGDGSQPSQPSGGDRKLAFLNGAIDRNTVSGERLAAPASPYLLQAGAVIAAAMITGLRSDLPGQIAAQVTENVYDGPTGRTLLIPQGSRLVGQYDAQVSFGQSRALLAWTRLILPNGRSIVLERQPGADPEGYAGLQDRVDNHWGQLFRAAVLSTLLSVGSEAGTSSNENDLSQALRRGASDSISQTGRQIVGRSLDIQPTITVRPGFPVRVIVTRDLILEPYRG